VERAEREADEEQGPISGVRVSWARVVVVPTPAPAPAPAEDVLFDVGEQVFFEVLRLVRALSPIQTPWLRLRLSDVTNAAMVANSWHLDGEKLPTAVRRRWHELVPGVAALDQLAHLIVDQLCD